ncbi:SDR family NAD(P)-dependent oxidoreductase [Sphingobium sp.]|uniref:SDR family NAD(P)-dependent oxidoreductase n=1 Tax=Sphingobium sp. TaxID=1912891 RepID=UPI002C9D32FC|nr:SDR family NAD(P)-dependent oxidoreductase [Sphingobium sp.]HUD90864.1 SDR family NAD(P)-dependent oxidoreductase [Sphingobium sp.]
MARYLVIGGAGGVGSALVSTFKAAGHEIIASVLNDQEAKAVSAAHAEVACFPLDLSDPTSVVDAVRAAIDNGPLDGVAVCAAVAPIGILETANLKQVQRTLDVNIVSALAIFQAVIPSLRASRGRIAFTSSMAGKVAMPFVGQYSASKFGLEGLADAMRREVAGQGVHVALVEPGGIRTPMVDAQLMQVSQMIDALTPEEERLYGAFYRGFRDAAKASHELTASTASQVAAVLVRALTDATPVARYIAGADAEQLIAAAHAMSDAEMDGLMAQMMSGETAPA